MSKATESVVFNAVPLLVLAAAYLAVGVALAPTLWRERARLTTSDAVLAFLFPSLAVLAATSGGVVLHDEQPIGGHVWVPFAAICVALVPPVLILLRWRERTLLATGGMRARAAEERTLELDRELDALAQLSNDLVRTDTIVDVARVLTDAITRLFGVEFAALTVLSEDGKDGRGVFARREGKDWPWWTDVRFDLEHDPSGVASAAFEGAPLAVYDVESSALISRSAAHAVGAKSAAFVPLVTSERVIAVLSVATTRERRSFSPDDLTVMRSLCAEAAIALERTRSADALKDALARERLIGSIARKLRAELDLDAVLQVAVEETARALGGDRCFVRLGRPGTAMPVAAEWRSDGLEPIGEAVERLPASNLAVRDRRTVAIGDVANATELEETATLAQLGTLAVLATPIVVFDELIGVLALHRTRAVDWTPAEIRVAEAVAHEAGLAVHVANLLEENEERLGQQSALLRAAQVLTGDLELEGVLQRLADQVAELLQADAADCYLLDPERNVLRCAAVHGLPRELVGFEFPARAGVAGQAIGTGRPVVASDYGRLDEPVPNNAYAGFTDVIVAPMRWSERAQGVLGVGIRGGRRSFSQADADVLEAFAGLASLALHNAETFTRSTRQASVQRGFYRIASVLGQSLSREATLDAVAQAASDALGGDFAAVLMPRRDGLELAGSHELPDVLRDLLARGLSTTETALPRAAEQSRLLAAPRLEDDDRFSERWRGVASSLLAVPVDTPFHGSGGLVIVFFERRRDFTDDDLELARHLADATRGALERSELFEAERTSRALAQQLARTGSLLATELDPTGVLDEVVQQAAELVGADACAIRLCEGQELVLSAAQGEGADEAIGERSPSGAWLSGEVAQSRAPVAVEDATSDARLADLDPLLAVGHAAFLGVPLVGPEGSLHGVLSVYARQPRAWRPEEVEAMQALAANTSAALSNAELYQRVAIEKERSFAILANIADGIVAVDRDGEVVLWNRAAEQITGVPAEEAVGRTPAQVLQRNLESEGDAPQGDRLLSIARGNEEVWLSLTEAVMRDPAGLVAGRIFAFRDISGDRLVEQLKSDFVATVSHELRTPLTSIYGFAQTLLRQDVLFGEEERRTFLGYIASESQRLTAIVDALLNVARLDTGDLTVNISPTDVRGVLSDVIETMEEAGGVNGHRFVVDLPPEPLAAEADPDKLRQVFSILVDNAVKYSPGGGTVTVGAKRKQNVVEVRVEDEGIGIPEAEQERIFRKFYRGGDDAIRLGGAGGTGLGLFIARGLVTAMGGRIWVNSREGQGSAFAFELPLARSGVPRERE